MHFHLFLCHASMWKWKDSGVPLHYILIYWAFFYDVARDRMNVAPNETQNH